MTTENTSTLKIVMSCIKQLTDEHGSATYQQILEAAAGISPHIVKERCDQLVNVTREVERISRGVYRAIKVFAPPRPISKTVLADGEVVLEIGDHVVHLTPQEERLLRGMFGSAPVEIHQPPPQVQAAQPVEPSPVMDIGEIACLFRVSRRFAFTRIIAAQGFPRPISGSHRRKMLWSRSDVEAHIKCVERV